MKAEQARRLERRPRVGERDLDRLELREPPAERFALPRISHGTVERVPGDPDRLQADEGARGFDAAIEAVGPAPGSPRRFAGGTGTART